MNKIKSNKAQCLECGEIVESKSHHDFVSCLCGNLSVDGGKAYLKRSIRNPKGYTDLSVIETVDEKTGKNYHAKRKRNND